MQTRVDVHELPLGVRPNARGNRRIDERAHRHAAFLREPEQHTELIRAVRARYDEHDVGDAVAELAPQRLELRVGQLGRALGEIRARGPGFQAEAAPEAVARLPRREARAGFRRLARHDLAAFDAGEARLDG